MVAVRTSPFGGMVPAVDDRLLPDINGAFSENTWLYAGTAIGLPIPKLIHTLVDPDAACVYRIPTSYTDAIHIEEAIWLEFPSADTQVLRSQVVDDSFDRYYWTSPLDKPRYLPYTDIVAQAPALSGYLLGIPQPGDISAVAAGGASSTLKTVAYVQTFVSAYGEEGPPSNPYILSSIKVDDTVTVTMSMADPGDLGTNRNLTRKRLYRTVTGTDGTTTYFFVVDLPIAQTTYADNATDQTVSLNSELESTTWTGPPDDLVGWVSMGNGMVVGWRENELWFCEPYRMHAWPAAYTLVTEYPIIGLGVSNQTLVVCTEGYAYTATGINPGTISLARLPSLLPCTARGSIVSAVEGVYFSTPNGLALVSPAGVVIATKELIRKDKWTAMVATSTLRAVQLSAGYFAFGQAVFGVFDPASFDNAAFAQEDLGGARRGVLIDPTSASVAFNLLTSADPIINVIADAWSNEIFLIRNGAVEWVDISDQAQPRQPYTWRSKIYQPAEKKNFQAMKIYFNEASDDTPRIENYRTPVMTDIVTDGVTVTASSEYNSDPTRPYPFYAAWGATDITKGWIGAGDDVGPELYINLGVNARAMTSYTLGGRNGLVNALYAPKTWELSGSFDGVSYTLIDRQENVPGWSVNETRTYPISDVQPYQWLRLKMLVNQGDNASQYGSPSYVTGLKFSQEVKGLIRVFADNRKVMERPLVVSGEQWRMPSGFKADFWQFEIEAVVEVLSMQVATSATELSGV